MFSWVYRIPRLLPPYCRSAALSSEKVGLYFLWSLQRKIAYQNRVAVKPAKGEDGIIRSDGRILNYIVPLKKCAPRSVDNDVLESSVNYRQLKLAACNCTPPQFPIRGFGIIMRYDTAID